METYNIFIIDVYNLFYKANYLNEETIVSYQDVKFHTEGIIGFLNMMESYIKNFGSDDLKIYWLFDNAKTSIKKYRKSLSEDYKKTRIPQPEWFYKELDMLELILKSYRDNSYLFRVQFIEADDYVSEIVKMYISKDDKVLLFSEDSDWFRALNDNIHQYAKSKIYTKKEFFEEYGFEATYSNICFYKVFYGDKTDNIKPALAEFPKMFFKDIIDKYKDVYQFLNAVKTNQLPYLNLGWIERIKRDEHILILNWNLVESIQFNSTELDTYKVNCKFQENKLYIIYKALDILGKVDTKRIYHKNNDNSSMFDDMLQGVSIGRKKSL